MPFMRGSSQCKGEYAQMVSTFVTEEKEAKAKKKAEAKEARRQERRREKEDYKQTQQAQMAAKPGSRRMNR